MILTAGHALITDFDGTLADLPVDWRLLRSQHEVASILDLWEGGLAAWQSVALAECVVAGNAPQVSPGHALALGALSCAILTNNSEFAVRRYLTRYPDLEEKVCAVIGRETLKGPKNDEACFIRGYRSCLEAISSQLKGPPARTAYLGDQDYELGYARKLATRVIDMRLIRTSLT
jgi:phosphoglycolate phosphatase-like HAD superfamily hydrolase